ncbi:DUF5805 domain-containing protein [Halanaeroarchaeum sulfurireducens]|uniref:Uncharacterized protein n=1 Tax=Halanaeroarchaeum sulfurireducens TaxID=1604004 RepID=A0A0F7PDX5_9EURY|nr:DUF5805 domain-containing protein [Halanaeroarchaeum sulfurireducens]AKH97819.1 hypothetical protein HLASF_1333 [Halanaeroarchaeum sulfurireducens]ALG82213.1 hypothetical protein HLASA_1320 [Halanaeroarchaeum sulfurireducens]
MDEETTTERSVVTTYVPAYQKERWEAHADELGMSQSEFVKTMVQAGRRGFGADDPEASTDPSSDPDPEGSDAMIGESDDLETTVLEALDENPYLNWDELVETVIGDVESDLEEVLTRLQEENEISHSPRHGGYVRMEE